MRVSTAIALLTLAACEGPAPGSDAAVDANLPATVVTASWGVWSDGPVWCSSHACASERHDVAASWAAGWVIGCGPRSWGSDSVLSLVVDGPGSESDIAVDALLINGSSLTPMDASTVWLGEAHGSASVCTISGTIDGTTVTISARCGPVSGPDPEGAVTPDSTIWFGSPADPADPSTIAVHDCDL